MTFGPFASLTLKPNTAHTTLPFDLIMKSNPVLTMSVFPFFSLQWKNF